LIYHILTIHPVKNIQGLAWDIIALLNKYKRCPVRPCDPAGLPQPLS